MVYLHLFHGRKDVDEQMNDWGEDGPTFGPFDYFHTTYATEIKFGEHYLNIVDDCVYYDGMYYGDWSVFGESPLAADRITPVPFDRGKTRP